MSPGLIPQFNDNSSSMWRGMMWMWKCCTDCAAPGPLAIEGPAPPPGTPIELDGKNAGEMRSSNGDRGLAYLRLAAADSGRPLTCGEAHLTPSRPDWFKRPES